MSILKTLASAALAAPLLIGVAFAQDAPPAIAGLDDPAEIERVQALIDGARQEGALEWTGTYVEPEQAEHILQAFRAHYGLEDLRTEYTYAPSGQIVTRVEQVLGAGRNNFDVVWIIAWAWYEDLLDRGEIAEYHSPYYQDYTLSNDAGMSREGYWVSDSYTFHPAYNPASLAQNGVEDFNPTSWNDFLDPRLRGLMSMGDVNRSTTYAPVAQGIHNAMGEEWFTELAENVEPVLFTQTAAGRDWLASGEFPITLMGSAKHAAVLMERGVEVELVYPEEGVPLLPFAPIILEQAPHPNAARLFIDYIRSAEGAQVVMDAGTYMFFGRPGVESPVPEMLPDWSDVNVVPMNWSDEGTEERLSEIREIFTRSGVGF